MSDPRETALQDMRAHLKAAYGLPDAQVILKPYGPDPIPRPVKPYFMVNYLSTGDEGQPEQTLTSEYTRWTVGKTAILRVVAVGDDAVHWLDALGLLNHLWPGSTTNIGEPLGSTTEFGDRHGDTFEYGAMRDFPVRFLLSVDTAAPVAAETIAITQELT